MPRVFSATSVRKDAEHVSPIMHQNPAVHLNIRRLIYGAGADPGPVPEWMARGLARAGAQPLPCKTARTCAPDIMAAVEVPLLDMKRATRAALPTGRIGMLASPTLRLTWAFDPVFRSDGMALISAVLAGQSDDPWRAAMRVIAHDMTGVSNPVLVACTEFSLPSDAVEAQFTESLDCLVSAIVVFAWDQTPGAEPCLRPIQRHPQAPGRCRRNAGPRGRAQGSDNRGARQSRARQSRARSSGRLPDLSLRAIRCTCRVSPAKRSCITSSLGMNRLASGRFSGVGIARPPSAPPLQEPTLLFPTPTTRRVQAQAFQLLWDALTDEQRFSVSHMRQRKRHLDRIGEVQSPTPRRQNERLFQDPERSGTRWCRRAKGP